MQFLKKIELLKREALHRSILKPEGVILINKCEDLVIEEMNDLEKENKFLIITRKEEIYKLEEYIFNGNILYF